MNHYFLLSSLYGQERNILLERNKKYFMKPFMTFSYADNIGWVTLQFHGTLHVLIFHFSHQKTVYEGGKRFIFTELKKDFPNDKKELVTIFSLIKKLIMLSLTEILLVVRVHLCDRWQ